MPVIWLSGTLDQATVTLLDLELAQGATGLTGVIIDLTGLRLIDSAGFDALVSIHWRASTRGDQLLFRHGPHVARQPVELTRAVRRRSRSAARPFGMIEQNLSFAGIDLDHSPFDDRPEAA